MLSSHNLNFIGEKPKIQVHKIKVGARGSPLSRAQLEEILSELQKILPIEFDPTFVETTGDRDLKKSLRSLDKTDFFTKELDQMLLDQRVRICIHSAKDLPDPIPSGIDWICLTQGIDSRDVVVMREGETFEKLPDGALIATSSKRREEMVEQMRPGFQFVDLRGKIGERLERLNKDVDGVIVAEAALIRLKLTRLNRFFLKEKTADFQGQLAILARADDKEMIDFFSLLDVRKNCYG